MQEAAQDLARVLGRVKAREMKAFEQAILESERVFVTGLGRTGLMARGFAMRLMHLGRRVFHRDDLTGVLHRQALAASERRVL